MRQIIKINYVQVIYLDDLIDNISKEAIFFSLINQLLHFFVVKDTDAVQFLYSGFEH